MIPPTAGRGARTLGRSTAARARTGRAVPDSRDGLPRSPLCLPPRCGRVPRRSSAGRRRAPRRSPRDRPPPGVARRPRTDGVGRRGPVSAVRVARGRGPGPRSPGCSTGFEARRSRCRTPGGTVERARSTAWARPAGRLNRQDGAGVVLVAPGRACGLLFPGRCGPSGTGHALRRAGPRWPLAARPQRPYAPPRSHHAPADLAPRGPRAWLGSARRRRPPPDPHV